MRSVGPFHFRGREGAITPMVWHRSDPGESRHAGQAWQPAALGHRPHLFHELAHLRELLHELVHIDTVVPEPAAIRRRRDPLMRAGSARSAFVIDEMIASILSIWCSASGPSGSCFAMPPRPGIIFRRSPSGPIFLTCWSCA